MAITKEKADAFQADLTKLLAKHKLELIVGPLFIDKLGNKHPITNGDITAELQVRAQTKNGTN